MKRVTFFFFAHVLLLGYSFEPRPNSRALGKEGSFTTIVFINKRMLALRKPVRRGRTRLACPEVRASMTSQA